MHTLGLVPSCGGEGGERVPGFTLFVHGPNCSKRQISDVILYQYSFCAGQLSCDQQSGNQLRQGLNLMRRAVGSSNWHATTCLEPTLLRGRQTLAATVDAYLTLPPTPNSHDRTAVVVFSRQTLAYDDEGSSDSEQVPIRRLSLQRERKRTKKTVRSISYEEKRKKSNVGMFSVVPYILDTVI